MGPVKLPRADKIARCVIISDVGSLTNLTTNSYTAQVCRQVLIHIREINNIYIFGVVVFDSFVRVHDNNIRRTKKRTKKKKGAGSEIF